MAFRLSMRRATPPAPREGEPQDGLPFGLHPVIDLMKMVGMIAESQRNLLDLIRSLNRALMLLAILWVLLAFSVVLR